jgi:outer membrane scaffolding protein for murein synthesis (MipA/OmpV family)
VTGPAARSAVRRALAALALAATALAARAEERPLWEFGLGATGLYLPDYRGANEGRGYVFPLPYFVYRGDIFRIDREGIRALFLDTDRVQLDVSVFGTPPVDSSRNEARQGMPDLDATLEIGPVLELILARDRRVDYTYRLRARVVARAVFPTDVVHWSYAGWVFFPNLALDLRPEFLGGRWNVGLMAGPLYATRQYNDYFYSVAPQFATPARPAYQAPGGFSGWTSFASVTRRFGKLWAGAYVRYDTLSGATFEASPLVKRDYAISGGIGIAWVFAESATRVESED